MADSLYSGFNGLFGDYSPYHDLYNDPEVSSFNVNVNTRPGYGNAVPMNPYVYPMPFSSLSDAENISRDGNVPPVSLMTTVAPVDVLSDRDRRIQAIDQRIATSPIPIEPYVSPKMADTQTNSNFMDNLGGLLFGGGGADGLEGYLSPQQQAAIQRQAMMQAAAALLKSSGRTTQPISLGQALGGAFEAGTAGYQGAQQNAIQQLLVKQKLDEMKRQKEMQGNVQQFLGQEAPEGVSANEFKAQQYMKLADLYAATNPDQATKFFDMAQKLIPRQKVTGQPFEVSDESGKPVMVQQFESGDIKTMAGFGPKRDVVLQNVDGRIVAIDKTKLTGGETYGTGITPAERERLAIEKRRLNLSEAEFKRGQYDRVENEDGVFYVPKVPGLPAIPVAGVGGSPLKGKAPPKPTEGETNAAGFANQMENAEAIIKQLPTGAQPGFGSAVAQSIPFIGGATERIVQSAQTQQYKQAAEAWIRSKLRKESGAAIGKDEMDKEFTTYFPQIGDSPAVIAQKETARKIATEAMKKSAGRSYTPLTVAPSAVVNPIAHPPVIQDILNKYPARTQ